MVLRRHSSLPSSHALRMLPHSARGRGFRPFREVVGHGTRGQHHARVHRRCYRGPQQGPSGRAPVREGCAEREGMRKKWIWCSRCQTSSDATVGHSRDASRVRDRGLRRRAKRSGHSSRGCEHSRLVFTTMKRARARRCSLNRDVRPLERGFCPEMTPRRRLGTCAPKNACGRKGRIPYARWMTGTHGIRESGELCCGNRATDC